jgi:hypothetical protein
MSASVAPLSRVFCLAMLAALPLLDAGPTRAAVQALDGNWSQLDSTIAAPDARREYVAIYDVQRDRYLIFGGWGFNAPYPDRLYNEIWTLSLAPTPTWTQLIPAGPGPGERHSPQWGYDPARQRLLVFGGYGHHYPGGMNEYLNDVWELSLDGTPTWTELNPSGTAPAGRLAGAAVYDPLRQRFVGFGGTRGLPTDTWELDLSGEPAWSTIGTDSTGPPGSYWMTMVYDPVRDCMLTFGGSTSDDYYGVHNDVWELSLQGTPTWTHLAPAGTLPAARRTGTAIYDPLRDRMVIYGGWDSQSNDVSSFLGDTWALSLSPELTWTQLAPTGSLPTGRDCMQAVYDPLRDRMVLYGGWSGVSLLHDTEFLDWGGTPTAPSITTTLQTDGAPARVSWQLQNVTGPHAAVYRRQADGPWCSVATVQSDGAGTVTYQDPTVTPGERYGYLVAVASQRGVVFGGETWVTVASAPSAVPTAPAALTLGPVTPNPLIGRFRVSFTLPSSAPASVELVDLAGRRLLAREVGTLGPGPHQLEVGDASAFQPGLYFLRLTQGDRSKVARVVIRR